MAFFSSILLTMLFAANTVHATVWEKSGGKYDSFGNQYVGASYHLDAYAYANSVYEVAYIHLLGGATAAFLNNSAEIAYANAKVNVQNGRGEFTRMLRVAGYIVMNGTTNFPAEYTDFYHKVYACRFLQASYDFALAGIPIIITGNAGAGGRVRVTYTVKPVKIYAGAWGGVNVWGNAGASVGIGAFGFELAGVGTKATVMDTFLSVSAGMGLINSYRHGEVYLSVRPLAANFYVEIWRPWPWDNYYRELAKWESPSKRYDFVKWP